jgi:Rrf2 family protein
VRIIRALADGNKSTVAAICEDELIPMAYAYKILKKLENAGLIQGLRGRNGGYQILKSVEAMSLYDIVTAVDESLFIFECLSDHKHCPLHQQDNPCAVHLEFERLQNILVAEMQAKTMCEVLQNQKNM